MGITKKYTIFIVDQQKSHQALFQKVFDGCPHLVCFCRTLDETYSLFKGVLPDIVLCNLQLPGLEPNKFLTSIRQQSGHGIRIIFSGEEQEISLMKLTASGLAHRYLCLPRDQESLKEIVYNALHIRSRVRVRKCWDFLKSGRGLPTLPEVVQELENVLQRPNMSLPEVVKVIEKDPSLTFRLLQIVNSAAFQPRQPIISLHKAVNHLGLGMTRKLVMFLCTVNYFQYPRKFHQHVLEVINHSMQCASLSSAIAEYLAPGKERIAATAGLLHDIGKLVFLSTMDESLAGSDSFRQKYRLFATEFEELTFGVSHLEMGSAMMLWWNLPLDIVDAAMNHSQPLRTLTGVTKSVAVADQCLLKVRFGDKLTYDLKSLEKDYPVDLWLQKAGEMVKTSLIQQAA
jgi:putative nucleotidyltransferase with HDIG domain